MPGLLNRLLGRDATPATSATPATPAPSADPRPAAPAAAAPAAAGLVDLFTDDHRRCDAAWAEVEEAVQAGDTAAATAAFERFDAAMRRHLAMEEEVLFPAFEAATGMTGGGPTFVMRFEHDQMRGVLDQMRDTLEAGDPELLLDHGDTLMMLIQQHNMKEEGMLYPMAEQHLAFTWTELAARLARY